MALIGAALALALLIDQARDGVDQAAAPSTQRAYRSDWADFAAWCEFRTLPPPPTAPESVALYLAGLARGGPPVRCAAVRP